MPGLMTPLRGRAPKQLLTPGRPFLQVADTGNFPGNMDCCRQVFKKGAGHSTRPQRGSTSECPHCHVTPCKGLAPGVGSREWEMLSEGAEVAQVQTPTKHKIPARGSPGAGKESSLVLLAGSSTGDSLSHLTVTAKASSAT